MCSLRLCPGIQGFARLCAGDVYEICVRLGSQEWRCRGTIGKDQQQRWSRPRRILRPTLADQLVIKVSGNWQADGLIL